MGKDNRISLTGLWEKELPDGQKYFSAKVGAVYYSVMKNTFKKKDNEPDYILYVSQNKKLTEVSDE